MAQNGVPHQVQRRDKYRKADDLDETLTFDFCTKSNTVQPALPACTQQGSERLYSRILEQEGLGHFLFGLRARGCRNSVFDEPEIRFADFSSTGSVQLTRSELQYLLVFLRRALLSFVGEVEKYVFET